MSTNNSILNRVFTRNTIVDFMNHEKNTAYSTSVKRYLTNQEGLNNRELISQIYKIMIKNYRNEYIYKNMLLNKLLIGRHSLRTTVALTEVIIDKSKADFILINGSAVVYEIKTELDTLDRLDSQIENYYKAFTKVCVITSESNYNKVQK